MATRFSTRGGEAKTLTGFDFLYATDTPVGDGAVNKNIADIQLVQLFLRHFYSLRPALFKKLPKPTTNSKASEVLVDGKVGRQTIAAIRVLQRDVIDKKGSGSIVDGKVSVPLGLRVGGTNHIFTIVQLNGFFFRENPANLAFNDNLENHPLVKPLAELVADLRTRKV